MRNEFKLVDFDLGQVKEDFSRVVEAVPWEVPALRLTILEGTVDGGTYSGPCCCLVGTIANNLGIGGQITKLTEIYGIEAQANSPIELFFAHIHRGETPENNPYSRQVMEWCDEFIAGEETKRNAKLEASVQAGLDEALAAALPMADEKYFTELVQV
jgi:hypothetical protein